MGNDPLGIPAFLDRRGKKLSVKTREISTEAQHGRGMDGLVESENAPPVPPATRRASKGAGPSSPSTSCSAC